MRLTGSVLGSALVGAAQGAAGTVVLFATSDRYTLSRDWFLVVMIVCANATGFAVAARYGLNLFGVAVAGLVGMMVGGWLGVHLIGSYEYTVPTPPEERELRITTREGQRVIPLSGAPTETVKRVPVGGGAGSLLGWVFGASMYGWLTRLPMKSRGPENSEDQPDDPDRSDAQV